MKTFKIVLTKSYILEIKAENANSAKEFSQIFTSDIVDISTHQDRDYHNFRIEYIDCKINEVFETIEINENSSD